MAPVQPAAQHVPAWKRLGLKLKYAKDEPEPTAILATVHDAESNKKRKATVREAVEGHGPTAPTKKAKKPKKTEVDTRNASVNGSDQKHDEPAASSMTEAASHSSYPVAAPTAKTPKLTKRKSVTFAPEAKTSDGDSTKDLYDRWLETQSTADASFDPQKAAPALKIHSPLPKPKTPNTLQSVSEEAKDPKKKKKKKKRKSKSTSLKPNKSLTSSTKTSSNPSAEAINGQPHPALAYLTAYHTCPSTWKFSKNHQTYLLKHLYSLSALPPSYNPALRSYLSGLQGRSARQKIRDAALKVREEDEMRLSARLAKGREPEWEKKRRREQYDAAWQAEKERLAEIEDAKEWEEDEGREEFEWRLKKRRRAEEVLAAVGETEPEARGSKITRNGNVAGEMHPAKKKRKRKRRTTGVPDDEESSSSSSSSSDSDSESESEKRLREALLRNKAQTPSSDKNADEASSSEDDASGSGSDEQDDEESSSESD